jgi:CHAT domain-containing protein
MLDSAGPIDPTPLLAQLGRLSNRRLVSFFKQHPALCDIALVNRLHDEVVRLAFTDVGQADRLARVARLLAELLADEGAHAQSLRAAGHVLYARGRWAEALECYDAALELFRRLGQEWNVARTLNGAIQTLSYLGRYDRAFAAAEEARRIFARHGDRLRIARLDINEGNLLFRQNRFEEALARYRHAHDELLEVGEPRDVATILLNIAVCCINLDDFDNAFDTYRRARAYCLEHGLPLLVLNADYNIASLHFRRGEYSTALELYRAVQTQSETLGDRYYRALCLLNRSDLYLELNLTEEGGELAERALAAFKQLEMDYEAAKALTNVALSAGQRGNTAQALKLFDRARRLFGAEDNQVSQALVDLYRAIVLHRRGRNTESARWCRRARATFANAGLPVKVAVCDLLLARLALERGAFSRASRFAATALERARETGVPALVVQGHFIQGLIAEAEGDDKRALAQLESAHAGLERLRSHLRGEGLRVAFLKDKVEVYEALVSVCLAQSPEYREVAFSCIEEAKSRNLADQIAFRATSIAPRARPDVGQAVWQLRQELNWYYHRIESEETRRERESTARLQGLRQRAKALEARLLETLRAVREVDEEFAALQGGGTCTLSEIQASLPSETTLVEYYQARDRLYACVVDRERLEIVPLAPASRVHSLFRLLQFQLSKFRLQADYTRAFANELQGATEAHLFDLYSELVAPIRSRIRGSHLIIVPHDILHCLPFHALWDGERFMIDDFTVSYAPSASVYRLCSIKTPVVHQTSLVMGVPTESMPHVAQEIHEVAATLPSPIVFMGREATSERLSSLGPDSRFIHIATHGLFRRDSPMFSSIELGNGPVSLIDLYELDLSAELVTLSGCSTGVNAVIGGDEVVGLVRGLLYSGARAVLLTLWDAYDSSTAAFMKTFYGAFGDQTSKSEAFQRAMQALRREYPHPFYWAPFILVGGNEVVARRNSVRT